MWNAQLERNYFTDFSLLPDPYQYFDAVREKGPLAFIGDPPVLFCTGYEEAVSILTDPEHFSSFNAASGPVVPLPFKPEGDDVTGQIEACRAGFPVDSPAGLLVNYDDEQHLNLRTILQKLFTPTRLKANEAFMEKCSELLVSQVVAAGCCEVIQDVAAPYVTYVIADLLGVPEDDRIRFKDAITESSPAGALADPCSNEKPVMKYMFNFFMRYLSDRRENPRNDVLTELAAAKFADGTVPPIVEMVKAAFFLFSAGQDTSALLLCNSLRFLVDREDAQERLRQDNSLIPVFIEEMMRMYGSLKMTSRLCRKTTKVGDFEISAGTPIAVILAAANRDSARWENPAEFDLNRYKMKQQLGFSRGPHTCLGAPLARAEVKVMLEQFLSRTSLISLDEEKHGPVSDRRWKWVPSFMNYGLKQLYLKLEPR